MNSDWRVHHKVFTLYAPILSSVLEISPTTVRVSPYFSIVLSKFSYVQCKVACGTITSGTILPGTYFNGFYKIIDVFDVGDHLHDLRYNR